ncbi:hypothetical protein ACSLVN_27935, partial [Klebsiella pneumoniae]|uniref:hypothetical protein n=1 Tax=Klebsiella pneumoniae TaxID=573 RepID=UPI003EE4226F
VKSDQNKKCKNKRFELETILDYYKNSDISKYQVKTQRSYKTEKIWVMSYATGDRFIHNMYHFFSMVLRTGLFDGIFSYG